MAKGELKDKMSSQEFREYLGKVERAKDSMFKAIPTTTGDGQKFKSILESTFYKRMWTLQQVGEVVKIEREIRFELIVNGVFIAAYMLDFRITYSDGRVECIDCKSAPTATLLYKMKKQLMLALYGIEIKEVYN